MVSFQVDFMTRTEAYVTNLHYWTALHIYPVVHCSAPKPPIRSIQWSACTVSVHIRHAVYCLNHQKHPISISGGELFPWRLVDVALSWSALKHTSLAGLYHVWWRRSSVQWMGWIKVTWYVNHKPLLYVIFIWKTKLCELQNFRSNCQISKHNSLPLQTTLLLTIQWVILVHRISFLTRHASYFQTKNKLQWITHNRNRLWSLSFIALSKLVIISMTGVSVTM